MIQPVTEKETTYQGKTESGVPMGMPGCVEMVPGLDGAVLCGRETILLVEDEAFVREVTVQVLQSAGYAVLTAKNAGEARHLYHEFSDEIDLLLADVILPDENGRTLAQNLRSGNVGLPALLVSGYAEQVGNMQAESAGVECLPKPFSARTLLEKIEMVLRRKRWSAAWGSVTHAGGIG